MPWRLIGSIIILAIVTTFIGFNLENACDVSFGFIVLPRVPVYLTVFISFVAGMVAVLPFAFIHSARKKKAVKASTPARPSLPAGGVRKSGKKGRTAATEAELNDGAYGVD